MGFEFAAHITFEMVQAICEISVGYQLSQLTKNQIDGIFVNHTEKR